MEGWLLRQELSESLKVPLALLALFALGMAFWLEQTRAASAAISVLALPVIALRVGTLAARESELILARVAVGLAVGIGALVELALARAVLGPAGAALSWLHDESVTGLLAVGALAAVPLEACLARSGVETRLAAWSAAVTAFAWVTPRMGGGDTLESLFGAVTVALVFGGGAGLAMGALARYLAGARV